MNLTEPIFRNAVLRPNAPAVFFNGRTLSHGELAAAVQLVAARCLERGIARGDRVAVTMGTQPLHLIVLLALARIGAVSVGLHMAMPGDQPRRLIALLGVQWHLHSSDVTEHYLAQAGSPSIKVDGEWLAGRAGTPVPLATDGHAAWRIGLSSGTTGTPKALVWTHSQTLLLGTLVSSVIPVGPETRFALLFDLGTFAGLCRAVMHLCAGACLCLPTGNNPADYIGLINSQRVTDAFTSPATAMRMLEATGGTLDGPSPAQPLCPGLRCLGLGGSGLTLAQYRALSEWITPAIFLQYGLTEGGVLAVCPPGMLPADPSVSGQCLPWVEGHAVDAQGCTLPPGQEGRLMFRSPLFCTAYEGDRDASAATFVDGWYRSGDCGSVDAAGLLRVSGRDDGLINLGGVKIKPEVVEAQLMMCQGIDDAAVFSAPLAASGRSVLLAAVASRVPIDEAMLRRKCTDALGMLLTPARIFQVASLPRNLAGKLMRQELAQAIPAGALDSIAPGAR